MAIPEPYRRITWRGYKFNNRTIAMIKEVEHRLGSTLEIYQGSYSTGVGVSAGTHSGGGAVDVWSWSEDPHNVVRVMRNVGFAAWYRTAVTGVWPNHIHAIAVGDKEMSSEAKYQVTDYYQGDDGLTPKPGGNKDPQPYRPSPAVVFDYREWWRRQGLLNKISSLSDRIKNLVRLREKAKRTLSGHH